MKEKGNYEQRREKCAWIKREERKEKDIIMHYLKIKLGCEEGRKRERKK